MEIEKIRRFIEICRPYNTLSGVLLFSLGVNFETRHHFDADILVGILIIVLGFTFATIQNDIEDKDIDECNSPEKALPSGAITSGEATGFIKVLGLMLACLSLYHAPRHVVPVLAAFLLTWAYNKSPFLLSRRPFGSIVLLSILYGVLPLLYSNILIHSWRVTTAFLLFIILYFLIRISVSILKDFKDEAGDKIFNKDTFYLIFGHRVTVWVSIICFSIGAAGILYLIEHGRVPTILLALPAILFFNMWCLRAKLLATNNPATLNAYFQKIFIGQNQVDLSLLLCLLLSR